MMITSGGTSTKSSNSYNVSIEMMITSGGTSTKSSNSYNVSIEMMITSGGTSIKSSNSSQVMSQICDDLVANAIRFKSFHFYRTIVLQIPNPVALASASL
jgi:hypothetical protein